jgi:hypothetical protein
VSLKENGRHKPPSRKHTPAGPSKAAGVRMVRDEPAHSILIKGDNRASHASLNTFVFVAGLAQIVIGQTK